jgi:hypothetical protein
MVFSIMTRIDEKDTTGTLMRLSNIRQYYRFRSSYQQDRTAGLGQELPLLDVRVICTAGTPGHVPDTRLGNYLLELVRQLCLG